MESDQPPAGDTVKPKRGRGRPRAAVRKELVTLRLDVDIIESFKAEGPGWQTRINDALVEAMRPKDD